jgi:hypothetical protein
MQAKTPCLIDVDDPGLYDLPGERLCEEVIPGILYIHGKQELRLGSIRYRHDKIIKLTHSHYLGIDQGSCFLYFFDDSSNYRPRDIRLLSVLEVDGIVTLDKVLSLFHQANPKEYAELLLKYLHKAPVGNSYVSCYRCIEGVIDGDIFLTVGRIRVLIDNDFHKTYLDTRRG